MALLREKIDMNREKTMAGLFIMDSHFLRQIKHLVRRELLQSSWVWTVFRWCDDYFDEFGKAPEGDIQDLYVAHSISMEESEAVLVAKFLQELSSNYEPPSNLPYTITQTEDYLTLRSATIVKDTLEVALKAGDVKGVETALALFKQARTAKSTSVDVINDDDEIIDAFTTETQKLFRFSGALGEVCGDFNRGDFIAWQAFAKGGKSWYLLYTANIGLQNGLKVLYVSFEMPKAQVLRRAWTGMTGRPRYDRKIRVPYFLLDEESTGKYIIDYMEEEREGFTPTREYLKEWRKDFNRYYRGGSMKVESFPSYSLTIKEFISYLENLSYFEDYNPDMIVVDYADLIGSQEKEKRHKLDDVWSNLRRYAMEKNICIVSASQSGRSSATADSTVESIAEDIRKVAHVTKLLAVNGTKEERNNGLVRISNLAEREGESSADQAYCTQCLDIGMPVLDSRLRSEVYTARSNKEDHDE